MKNELHHRNFGQLLSDAIFFEQLASNENDELRCKRFVRASISSSLLMLESAANCCLSCFDANENLMYDLEKLPPVSKLDLFALHGYKKGIDYSRNEVQKIREIKQIRDKIVHPKVCESKIGNLDDKHRNFLCFPAMLPFSSKPKPATNIVEISSLWSYDDCLAVIKSIVEFFNYYFKELLSMDKKLVFGILNDSLIIDGKAETSIFPPDLFNEIIYLKNKGIIIEFIVDKP